LVFFGPVGVLYTQLAPAKIYGWENEVSYHATRNTDVSGSFSLMGSKFEHLMVGPSYPYQFDFSGQQLDRVPHFNATLALNQYFPLGNGSEIRFRGAIKYNSGYYLSDLSHAVRYRQSAFTRSDMSVTYAFPEDRFTVQLFVENIENKVQKTSGPGGYLGVDGGTNGDFVPSPEGGLAGFPAKSVTFGVSTPRFYGVRLGVKF
jgi:iron complex outermembrane receptor protein